VEAKLEAAQIMEANPDWIDLYETINQ